MTIVLPPYPLHFYMYFCAKEQQKKMAVWKYREINIQYDTVLTTVRFDEVQ